MYYAGLWLRMEQSVYKESWRTNKGSLQKVRKMKERKPKRKCQRRQRNEITRRTKEKNKTKQRKCQISKANTKYDQMPE